MTIKTLFLSAPLILALYAPNVDADSPLPKKDLGDVAKHHFHQFFFSQRNIGKNVVLPKAETVYCSTARDLGKPGMIACITRDEKEGPWSSLIFDINNNKDLTDDPSYKIPQDTSNWDLKLKANGAEHLFSGKFQSNGNNFARLLLYGSQGWTGKVLIDGNTVMWTVVDCNLNNKADYMDTAFVDMNADNKIAPGNERAVLKPDVLLAHDDGRWFSIAPDSASNQLKVELYKGEMYSLSFDESKILKDSKLPISLTVMHRDGTKRNFDDVRKSTKNTFPAGILQYVSGTIAIPDHPLRFSMRNIKLQKDTLIALEKPSLNLRVLQSNGKLHINRSVVAAHGVSYSLKRGRTGPLVECFAASDMTKPLIKGNMKYG